MRTEQERAQIRSLIGSPQWATVVQTAEELCTKIKNDVASTDNQWESTRNALLAEGKAGGIRQFLQQLGQEASYDPES